MDLRTTILAALAIVGGVLVDIFAHDPHLAGVLIGGGLAAIIPTRGDGGGGTAARAASALSKAAPAVGAFIGGAVAFALS